MQTTMNQGLKKFVWLLDASIKASAVFEDMELQALTFFASRLVMWARSFPKEDHAIYVRCLKWNLTVPFLWYNCNG